MSNIPRLILALGVLCATAASADVWDTQAGNDDDARTENELVHGTVQAHDLGVRPGPVADQDWFRIPIKPHASYEVIVDGAAGDLHPGLTLERLQVSGTSTLVVQSSLPVVQGSSGFSRTLRWANATSSTITDQRIRVAGAQCATACGPDDVYSLRVRETTVHIARFNQSGAMETSLFVQNVSDRSVVGTVFYWNASGGLITSTPITLSPKTLILLDLVVFVPGQSGHITIAHNGGWGGLNAKTSTKEPPTGFSFDTQGVNLP